MLERGLDLAEASTVLQGKLRNVQLIASRVPPVLVLKRLRNNNGGRLAWLWLLRPDIKWILSDKVLFKGLPVLGLPCKLVCTLVILV